MLQTQFVSPVDGATIDDPQLELLRQLILYGGQHYWGSGSGSAEFTTDANPKASLQIMYTKPHKFFVECRLPEQILCGQGSDAFDETVKQYVCGEPMQVPQAFYISEQQALLAVEHFLKTGQPHPDIRWASADSWDEWD